MKRRLLTGIVVLILSAAAGCTGGDSSIEGVWLYESYSVEGEPVDVAVDVNAARQPYVVAEDRVMRGEAGCNSFGGDFMYSQGALDTREVIAESAGCSPERLMEAELAFTDLIWGDDRIQVSFSGDTMTWRAGEDILKFVAVDTEPVAPTLPPQTSFGPLDCGDAVVVRDTVPASGSDFDSFAVEGRSLIEGIEDVSSIEQPEPNSLVWFGNDNKGATVAAVAFDDMQPATFSIYTCP